MSDKKKIVILGAGFGGLSAARQLAGKDMEVTIVDRQNHHLFQPLLYQVATSGLSSPDISHPVRSLFSSHPNVQVLMDEVQEIDLESRQVLLGNNALDYDYLVVALGSQTSYFGNNEWEKHAPGLKSISDALTIRNRILHSFELAENEESEAERRRLMTAIVVGGGPTGVELAGAFAELGRHVLRKDFRRINPAEIRVVLIEAMDRILPQLPADLADKARSQLENLGVDVRTSSPVQGVENGVVHLEKESLQGENLVWTAGVQASPVARMLTDQPAKGGRVAVADDLSLPEHPEVFVIGDMAAVNKKDGNPVPGVAPAAMQMGKFTGKLIAREALLGTARRPRFRYLDKGTMATIGRSAAVAMIGRMKFGGFSAWLAWLVIHLLFLVGFRNKLVVLIQWIYHYIAFKSGARLIIGYQGELKSGKDPNDGRRRVGVAQNSRDSQDE